MASLKTLLATLVFLSRVDAYWRMPCGIIQTGRIDPIINPGGISQHVHKISGPPNINPNSDFASLQDNRCTSCQVQADKSAYWTPLLYYRHSNGSFEEVPADGMVVYYLGRGENASYIQSFPEGFRMLSGNPFLRAYDNSTYTYGGTQGVIYTGGHCQTGDMTCVGGKFVPRTGTASDPPGPVFYGRPVSDRVSFNCLDAGGPYPETYVMSRTSCSDGLRAQIQFPSCWDGVHTYLADNSHVDYMSQIDNGVCPPSHPVLMPHLFFEVLYGVDNIQTDGGELVFAMGDPTGYGFHGDFLNGWDLSVLQQAITSCVNVDNGGDLGECAPFQASLDYNSGYNCPEQPPYLDEVVHGMVGSKLPGCNPVIPGPAPVTPNQDSCPANATTPQANTTYHYGSGSPPSNPTVGSVSNNYGYVGCFSDDSAHSFSQASTQSSSMTNSVCQAYCKGRNMPLAATEFGSQCFCGYSLNSTINAPSSCNNMICAGNNSEYCGGGLTLNVWNSTTYTGSYDPTLPPPGTNIGGGIQYLGCANELTNARALNVQSTTSQINMTNQFCASFCQSQGLPMFATEYSSECYCGNSLASGSQFGQSGCTMGCSGNPPITGPFATWANICGGSNRLAVWNFTGVSSVVGTTSTPTPSTTTGATVPVSSVSSKSLTTVSSLSTSLIASVSSTLSLPSPSATVGSSYRYLGCASEGTGSRALNQTTFTSSSNMTNDLCASACASQGLPLFGTEYSAQCYCGIALASGSQLGQTGCNMACSGPAPGPSSPFAKVSNICGGANRLTLWNNTAVPAPANRASVSTTSAGHVTSYTYAGCYAEGMSGYNIARVLNGASYSDTKNMTIESCVGFCSSKGFSMAGTEFADECYCGNAIGNGGQKANEWDCQMQCTGDSGRWCGGSSRLSVYQAQ